MWICHNGISRTGDIEICFSDPMKLGNLTSIEDQKVLNVKILNLDRPEEENLKLIKSFEILGLSKNEKKLLLKVDFEPPHAISSG